MLFVHFNFVFENMTGLIWVARQPSLMFFFLSFLLKGVFCVNGRLKQFLAIKCARVSVKTATSFPELVLIPFPPPPKHWVKPAVCLIEASRIYRYFCFLVDTINDTCGYNKWHFCSSWQSGFRLIYTAVHFLLCKHSKLEQRKHEQTSKFIYIQEKLEIVNKTDSCEPNYALKGLAQEQSICMSLYPKLFEYR